MSELMQKRVLPLDFIQDEQKEEDLCQFLEVGTTAFLEIGPKSGCPQRYKTTIRGWEQGLFLLVDRPFINAGVLLRRGQPSALRFIREGVVWGFYTTISDPSPDRAEQMVLLAWPKEARHVHLRRYDRIRVLIPCSFHLLDGNMHPGIVQDMSYGGCCLETDTRLWEGMGIWLNFMLPDGMAMEELPLCVRNHHAENNGKILYGCAFTDEKEAEHSGIGLFINRKITMERGQAGVKAQCLLLSEAEEDLHHLRETADTSSLDIRRVNGLVDLFYQIRVQIPIAIFINSAQRNISALNICRILRSTSGLDAIKLIVYGNQTGHDRENCLAAGVSCCLPDLSDSGRIQSVLGIN